MSQVPGGQFSAQPYAAALRSSGRTVCLADRAERPQVGGALLLLRLDARFLLPVRARGPGLGADGRANGAQLLVELRLLLAKPANGASLLLRAQVREDMGEHNARAGGWGGDAPR